MEQASGELVLAGNVVLGSVDLLTMLQPYRARVQSGPQQANEVRSPLPGFFESKLVEEGKTVAVGEEIISLSPAEEQVWEALRALYLVGQPEDLPDIERFTGRAPHMGDRIQQQARLTVAAIKQRNSPLGPLAGK